MSANRQSIHTKQETTEYVLEFKDDPCCSNSKQQTEQCTQGMVFMCILIYMSAVLGFMIGGNVQEYPAVIKYRNWPASTCYGGLVIQNMQITPLIFNTTLTYSPATLHFTTLEVGTNKTVRFEYPTYFNDIDLDCVEDKYGNNPCDRKVGDLIMTYDRFLATDKFKCYLERQPDGTKLVIGLGSEQDNLSMYFGLATVGILLCSLGGLAILFSICMCCLEAYEENQQKVRAKNNAKRQIQIAAMRGEQPYPDTNNKKYTPFRDNSIV
jgi:hypothetical protein